MLSYHSLTMMDCSVHLSRIAKSAQSNSAFSSLKILTAKLDNKRKVNAMFQEKTFNVSAPKTKLVSDTISGTRNKTKSRHIIGVESILDSEGIFHLPNVQLKTLFVPSVMAVCPSSSHTHMRTRVRVFSFLIVCLHFFLLQYMMMSRKSSRKERSITNMVFNL